MPLYLTLRQLRFNPRQKLSNLISFQIISEIQFEMLLKQFIVIMARVDLLATNNLLTVLKSMVNVPIGWLV